MLARWYLRIGKEVRGQPVANSNISSNPQICICEETFLEKINSMIIFRQNGDYWMAI